MADRTFLALLTLGLLSLAGCSDKGSSDATPTPSVTPVPPVPMVAPPPAPNMTAPPPEAIAGPFTMDGFCEEFLVIVPITMEQARRFVPANYTPLADATGRAAAFAGLKICDASLDGEPAGMVSTADVGINIVAPDGGTGNHYYQPWWLSDNEDLASRLVAQGWAGGHTENTTLTSSLTSGVGEVSVDIPWPQGVYSARGTVAGLQLPPAMTFTGWHDGTNGTVTVVKTLTSTSLGAGTGFVTATGPLAELMGASATGVGVHNVYDITSTVGPA